MRRLFLLIFLIHFSLSVYANQSEYPPISPDNVMNLGEISALGDGRMNPILAWSPDGSQLVAGASRGIYFYNALNAEPQFIELGLNIQSLLFASHSLLFLSDGHELVAFDLATMSIQYTLEGLRPLAVSHDGTMLAYEVDMAVRVLAIDAGEILYELDYNGILDSEEIVINEYLTNDNRFIFAQFYPDDSGLIVRWTSDTGYRGGGYGKAGTDFWDFSDLSREPAIERYPNINSGTSLAEYSFAALDSNGDYFGIGNRVFLNSNGILELGMDESTYIRPDDERISYALQGDLIALPVQRIYYQGNSDNLSIVVNIITGEVIQTFEAQGVLAFSPDGNKITIGAELYLVETGERLRLLQADTFAVLPNTPDRILRSASDDSLRLIDGLSLQEQARLPIQSSEWGHYYRQPSGKLYFYGDYGRSAIVFDAPTGEETARFYAANQGLDDVYFSTDGQFMVSTQDLETVLNLSTGEVIALPDSYILEPPYFHPNGTVVVWSDASLSQLLLFDIESETIQASFPADIQYAGDAFSKISPDGRFLVLGEWQDADIWDVENQSILSHIAPRTVVIAFSSDSRYLAYFDDIHSIIIFDLLENRQIHRIQTNMSFDYFYFIDNEYLYAFKNSPDFADATYSVITGTRGVPNHNGYRFAEANNLVFFREWQAIRIEDNQSTILHYIQLDPSLTSASLSSDGSRLYINYTDGRVGIWAAPE